jgi:uncharacterized membrane protein
MFERNIRPAATAVLTALALSAVTVVTQAADAKQDFGTQTCKEVMRLSGSDRDIALAFAHGYVLGKKGTTQYEVDALAQVTDQFIDYCLDNPAANALQSFEKFAM